MNISIVSRLPARPSDNEDCPHCQGPACPVCRATDELLRIVNEPKPQPLVLMVQIRRCAMTTTNLDSLPFPEAPLFALEGIFQCKLARRTRPQKLLQNAIRHNQHKHVRRSEGTAHAQPYSRKHRKYRMYTIERFWRVWYL